MPSRFRSSLILVALSCAVSACGGSGSNPDGQSQGCFAIVGNKGTVTASITALDSFAGIVPTGGAVLNSAGNPFFSINAINTKDGTGVLLLAPVSLGAHAVGPSTLNTVDGGNSITVQARTCTGSAGQWVAGIAFGSGTITVNSASSTGVSGAFNATLLPAAGSTGTKTISGTFNVTY